MPCFSKMQAASSTSQQQDNQNTERIFRPSGPLDVDFNVTTNRRPCAQVKSGKILIDLTLDEEVHVPTKQIEVVDLTKDSDVDSDSSDGTHSITTKSSYSTNDLHSTYFDSDNSYRNSSYNKESNSTTDDSDDERINMGCRRRRIRRRYAYDTSSSEGSDTDKDTTHPCRFQRPWVYDITALEQLLLSTNESSNSRGRKRRVTDTTTQSTDDDDSCAGYETDISDYLVKPSAKKQRYFAYSSSDSGDSSSDSDVNNESKGMKRIYDDIDSDETDSDETDFQETKNALEAVHKKRRFQ